MLRAVHRRVAAAGLRASRHLGAAQRSRQFFGQSSEDQKGSLATTAQIHSWINDPKLVDQNLGVYRAFEMWLMLRMLRGLELPEFLEGCSHAYTTVSWLMYEREWEALSELVSPGCLAAMQSTMDEFLSERRRIEISQEQDIQLNSVLLSRARVLEAPDDHPGVACHLDVKFIALESFQIFDYETNEAVPYFDQPRTQESTWRFEGTVSNVEGDNAPETSWKLFAIV